MSIYRNSSHEYSRLECCWENCRAKCEDGISVCREHALIAYAWVLGNVTFPDGPETKRGKVRTKVHAPAPRPTSSNPDPSKKPRHPNSYTQGTIYAIQTQGDIKIGFTTNLKQRMATLRPDAILGTMPGTMYEERKIHRLFRPHWIDGEWFRSHQDILDFIAENMTKPDADAA